MKRILSIFLCLTLILGFCPGQTAYAAAEWPSEISISADGGILMDINSGAVLFEKNSHEPYYPASITKILTALIVIENCGLDETVTFSNTAVNSLEPNSSILGARAGDTLSVRDCLYALLLQSANEVANALAEHCAGSIDAFAEKMNETAHALGATDTHFVNPHGLSNEDHYTTAYDLYLIFNEAMKYPEFQKIIGTVSYRAEYTDGTGQTKIQEWKNSNQYLNGKSKAPDGITILGGKTGTTRAAGSCLILGSQDESGNDYISVVLKAESRDVLYDNMTKIIGKIVN